MTRRRGLLPFWFALAAATLYQFCMPASSLAGSLVILYPEDGSAIPNDWVPLLVQTDPRHCDDFAPTLVVDGKAQHPPKRPPTPFRPDLFFLHLSPGRHQVTVAYVSKQTGGKCRASVTFATTRPGPLRSRPVDEGSYSDIRQQFDRTIAGFRPAGVSRTTALVRTRSRAGNGMRERFWVVPREDERKAIHIIDGPPHLAIDTEKHFPATARGCFGDAGLYAVAADLEQEKQIGVYFLDATGRVETRKINKNEILDRLFADGLVPPSWAARARQLRAWRSLSVLYPPDYYGRNRGRPLLCSDALAVVPLWVNCINVACRPSNLPVYLVLHRGGGYRLYKPEKARFDKENGWMGPDLVVPFGERIFTLDLEEAIYRILDEGKTYPLPLLSSLRKGQSAHFGGYLMEISDGAVTIHLRYFNPNKPYDPETRSALGSTLVGVISAVLLPDRLLLKQTLLWPGRAKPVLPGWPREYDSIEFYYEIGVAGEQ